MTNKRPQPRPTWRLALAAGVLMMPLSGCDLNEVLSVEDPEFASPESLSRPEALPTLVAGALGDFQVAYSGAGGDSFLSVVALITDEFVSTGTFTTRTATDQRDQFPTVQGNTSDGAYVALHRARRALGDAAVRVEDVLGTQAPQFPLLKALEGVTYVALGEGWCAPMPFGFIVEGNTEYEVLSQAQIWEEAIERFDAAIAAGGQSNNVAKVGKGRALLNAGRYEEAAAAVNGVPTTFVYDIEHSTNSGRQENPLFSLQDNGRYSIADEEGGSLTPWTSPAGEKLSLDGEGLPYLSSFDPRVPWTFTGAAFDQNFPLFLSLRYPDFGADVPVLSGVEARLIEAEAALKLGQTGQWLAILNDLRDDAALLMGLYFDSYADYNLDWEPGPNDLELEPLADPGTERARQLLMFRERAFWLYNTGHRLGDLRRMIRQYGFAANEVYPSGEYFKGGTYGDDVAFYIPFDEANIPAEFEYDINSCDVTVP